MLPALKHTRMMRGMMRAAMRGFSLLELMVAVAISLLLLMGVIALFISSRASYETTERLSRIQESGRFALDQIINDLRASGYQGCSRAVNTSRRVDYAINRLKTSNTLLWNFTTTTQGFDGRGGTTFAPTLAATLTPPAEGVGDVLVMRIPKREVATLYTTVSANPTSPLTVPNVTPEPFRAGDTAMVTDCEARAWFEVTSYNAGVIGHVESGGVNRVLGTDSNGNQITVVSPGNTDGTLLHPFRVNSQVVPVDTVIYYLARSTAFPSDPTRFSLWRKTGGTNLSDEIADGIDRLEVLYGQEVGGVMTYVDASAVTNWDNVLTVQLAVLARAPDAYGNDLDTQQHILFSNPRVTAGPLNDRAQRKVFTATVAVRNQIID